MYFPESLSTFMGTMRVVLLGLGAIAALACTAAWAVRTRRVNAFGPIARLVRAWVDPLLRPTERMILRAGGTPATAPWWVLMFVLISGVIALSAVESLYSLVVRLVWTAEHPAQLPMLLLSWAFALLRIALIVRVFSSWLPISPYSRWIRWSYLLTEWMLAPLRRVIPTMGAMDLTPLVAYFALWLLQSALHVP